MLMLIRLSKSNDPSALYSSLVSEDTWPAGEYLSISRRNVCSILQHSRQSRVMTKLKSDVHSSA